MHSHQNFLWPPFITSAEVSFPFLVGCHSAAISGASVARSLNPVNNCQRPQYGHPTPFKIEDGVFLNSWPRSQVHQYEILELTST